MRTSSIATLVIAAAITSITRAGAQTPDSVRGPEVGTRVRVLAPDLRTDRYIGRIKTLDGSVMVLDTGEVRTVLGME